MKFIAGRKRVQRIKPKTYFPFMYLLSSLVCLYNFREKGLFLGGGGQNVISWGGGHKGGLGGHLPPSLYVKKGPETNEL